MEAFLEEGISVPSVGEGTGVFQMNSGMGSGVKIEEKQGQSLCEQWGIYVGEGYRLNCVPSPQINMLLS